MKIGILGAGRMAQMLVPKLVSGGHRVILSNSSGPASLQPLVQKLGPSVSAAEPRQMLAVADVVILATPWEKTPAAVAAAGAWAGKVVIDTTNNRRGPRPEDLIDIGGRGSSDVIAQLVPGAQVVKTFNYEPISVFAAGLPAEGDSGAVFFSGDDAQAKSKVAQLIRDMGGEPIDAGSLADGGRLHGMGGPLSLKMQLLAPKAAKALFAAVRQAQDAGTVMIDRPNFREAMSRLVGAVTVITTDGPAGLGGFTASAVCSVTDDPPMLLACMNRNSRQHAVFMGNGVLCVNVLTAAQEQVSRTFASGVTVPERFQGERWTALETGAPALDNALVNFDARILQTIEAGTHSVFLCGIVSVRFEPKDHPGLAYYGRKYHPVAGQNQDDPDNAQLFLRPLTEFW